MKSAAKKRAITLAKTIAKIRDGYICQKCGNSLAAGFQMHGSHIMPETWAGTAADPENILCLCANCHVRGRDSWHQEPVNNARWLEEKYPGLYDKVRTKALEQVRNKKKIDWPAEVDRLKALMLEYA